MCKNYIIKENIKPKLFNKRSITFLTSRIILVCRNRSFQTEPRCGKRCENFQTEPQIWVKRKILRGISDKILSLCETNESSAIMETNGYRLLLPKVPWIISTFPM